MFHSSPDRRNPTVTDAQRGSSGNISTEAYDFISAAGITDYTQITAVTYLVNELKDKSLWDKMKVIYPFVGATSQSHQLNLKDPTANALTFSNISHTSAGISATNIASVGSAVSAYSSVNDSTTDTSFGYYGTTIYSSPNNMLVGDTTTTNCIGVTTVGSNNVYYRAMGGSAGSGGVTYSSGFLGADGFKMVSILGTTARVSTNQIENNPFTSSTTKGNVGWRMLTNVANSTSNTYSFFFVGYGLTSDEMLTLHNIVGTYQGILGRSLYSFDASLHPWTNRFKSITGLTDSIQIYAVNQLINSLNNNGWLNTSFMYVYPFVGSDLTKYAYSLDGSAGTLGSNTFSSLGLDPNVASNAGISTALTAPALSTGGGFVGFYCNEESTSTSPDVTTASSNTGGGPYIYIRNTSNQFTMNMFAGGNTVAGTNTSAIGSYHIQIPAGLGSSFSSTAYKNGVAFATSAPHGSVATGVSVRVPGSFTNGAAASRRFAISYIGNGSLTAGQISILNNIITTYVTALGRQ